LEKSVYVYRTLKGREPYNDWLSSLHDNVLCYRIDTRIERIRQGNYGDYKRFHGIIEIRMDFGKGYRLYCAEHGNNIVILLAGGDKSSQDKNISDALDFWRDYREQNKV
jgi:putative addiction module killer protein